MITDIEIANALYSGWNCEQFDSLQHEISGMQSLLIYTHQWNEELADMLHMLWGVAVERRSMQIHDDFYNNVIT